MITMGNLFTRSSRPETYLTCKLLFIGPARSGKSKLRATFSGRRINEFHQYEGSIGIDFSMTEIIYNHDTIRYGLYEASGSTPYFGIYQTYIKEKSVIVLCYTKINTLKDYLENFTFTPG